MSSLIAHYGVLMVVIIIYAGEIGLPTLVPGEIAILIVGSQVIRSVPQLLGVWLLFGIVDVCGCSSIHLASRTGGNRLLLRLLRRLLPDRQCHEQIIAGWRRRLGGRDALVVFVTRLIPVFRLYGSVTTGLIRVRLRDFISGAIPASLLWASIPLSLGYLLRTRIHPLVSQYPRMLNVVILVSVVTTLGLAVAMWARSAGSRAGALRRIRIVFGLGAVGGALTRLVLMALYGDLPLSNQFLLPSVSALSVWITIFSCVALGLLWIAHGDLQVIRRYQQTHRGIGMLNASTWIGLMTMFCILNTLAVGQAPALLG